MKKPYKFEYYPAQLYKGKRWYIAYYITNPSTGQLVRKVIKWNRIKNLRDREKEARVVVRSINEKLAQGWNPFIEMETPRSFVHLSDALNRFSSELDKAYKDGAIRKDTIRSYRSYLNVFKEWVGEEFSNLYCIWLTRQRLQHFLDYIYYDRNTSPRTRNNHLSFWITVGEWLLKKEYLKVNPALGIEKVRQGSKKRVIISEEDLQTIFSHLSEHDHAYYTLCMTIYYTFIRRKELAELKVKHVLLDTNTILIPAYISKNRKDDIVTIPDRLYHILRFHIMHSSPEDYLFSVDAFKTGKNPMNPKKISDRWAKIRKDLLLPEKYQFYSLKDTGITAMLKAGVAPITVRDQARHHSIKQTDEYTPHEVMSANPTLIDYDHRTELKSPD